MDYSIDSPFPSVIRRGRLGGIHDQMLLSKRLFENLPVRRREAKGQQASCFRSALRMGCVEGVF